MNISKRDLKLFIILMGICIPQGIAGLGIVSKVSTLIKLVAFLYAGILLLRGNVKPDNFFGIWMAYFSIMLVSTIVNAGNLSTYISKYYPVFAMIILSQYFVELRGIHIIKITGKLFAGILVLNSILGVLYNTTLMSDAAVYFLGIRTRINDLAYVGIVFALAWPLIYHRGWIWPAMGSLSAIYFILSQKVSTGYICIPLLLIFIALSFLKTKVITNNGKKIYWMIIVINVLVISGGILSRFGWFFSDILGEDATLTGRTNIWSSVLSTMPGKWILGHGIGSARSFMVVTNNTTATHSQLLNELYNGGLVGVTLFILITYLVVKKCKDRGDVLAGLVLSGIFATQIAMISEVVCDSNFYNVYLILCYYLMSTVPPIYYEDSQEELEDTCQHWEDKNEFTEKQNIRRK